MFVQLLSDIWNNERISQAWNMGKVIKIPKKGDNAQIIEVYLS